MALLIGTSGWQYRDWRDRFYPTDVPMRRWLDFYADRFPTVEVNNAFYRLPSTSVFQRWREHTPPGFTVALKASRFLTHTRRLRDPREPVNRLMGRATALGDRLGPVLLQLPPTMRAAPDRLAECLAAFPRGTRVAVEARHDSWWSAEIRRVLERHGAALCWADRLGRPVTPLWRTTNWSYLRLHTGRSRGRPSYPARVLREWLDRLVDAWPVGADGYVYFNNDPEGAAPSDAGRFATLAGERGLAVPEVVTTGR